MVEDQQNHENGIFLPRCFSNDFYAKRKRINPNMAKQNRDVPDPMPVIALLATPIFFDSHGDNTAIAIISIANKYKLGSLKMFSSQKK